MSTMPQRGCPRNRFHNRRAAIAREGIAGEEVSRPAPFATSATLATSTALRIRHLAEKIHGLGPRPTFELLCEIVGGADPMERIERYGRLAREHDDLIRSLGGGHFPQRFYLLDGGKG